MVTGLSLADLAEETVIILPVVVMPSRFSQRE